jgi:hypothetical protein
MTTIGSMCFDPPPGFGPDETMLSLRPPAPAAAAAGGRPASSSLIVHHKRARPGASLGELAGEAAAELARSLSGMLNLSKAEFLFDDGATGVLLSYDFPVFDEKTLRQYHVYRLDGDHLTTMTLTIPDEGLDKAAGAQFFRSLASLRPLP